MKNFLTDSLHRTCGTEAGQGAGLLTGARWLCSLSSPVPPEVRAAETVRCRWHLQNKQKKKKLFLNSEFDVSLNQRQTLSQDPVCLFSGRPLLRLLLRGFAFPSQGVAVGDHICIQVLEVGVEVQNLMLVRAQQRKSLRRRGRRPPPEHFSQASEQSQETEESWKKKG